MAQEELKGNLLHPGQWLRMLFMLGYVFVLWVVGLVLLVVMITQTVAVLFTGTTNSHLKHFGIVVNIYLFQIVDFLVYGSEQKPFPFKAFPDTHVVPPGSAPGPASTTYRDPGPDEPVVTPYGAAAASGDPASATAAAGSPPTGPYTPAAATSSPPPDSYMPPPVASPYPDAPVPDPYADLDGEPDTADRTDAGFGSDADDDDTKRI